MTPTPPLDSIREWIYQLECIAPKVYAKQHMAVTDVLAYLSALAGSRPPPIEQHDQALDPLTDAQAQIERARQATTALRDAARAGRVIGSYERDPLVLAIHEALDGFEAALCLSGVIPQYEMPNPRQPLEHDQSRPRHPSVITDADQAAPITEAGTKPLRNEMDRCFCGHLRGNHPLGGRCLMYSLCECDGFELSSAPPVRLAPASAPQSTADLRGDVCERYCDIWKVGNEWLAIHPDAVCPRCGYTREEHRASPVTRQEQAVTPSASASAKKDTLDPPLDALTGDAP